MLSHYKNYNINELFGSPGSTFSFLLFFLLEPLPVSPHLCLLRISTSRINSCTSSLVGHCPSERTTLTTSFAEIAPRFPVQMSDKAKAWLIFNNSSSENLPFPCEIEVDLVFLLPFPFFPAVNALNYKLIQHYNDNITGSHYHEKSNN